MSYRKITSTPENVDCHPGCFVQEEDNADGAPVLSRHARTQPDFGGQEAGLKCSSIDEEESLSTPSGTTKRKKVVQATLVAIPFAKNNQHSHQQEEFLMQLLRQQARRDGAWLGDPGERAALPAGAADALRLPKSRAGSDGAAAAGLGWRE